MEETWALFDGSKTGGVNWAYTLSGEVARESYPQETKDLLHPLLPVHLSGFNGKQYTWDKLHRLTRIEDPAGTNSINYLNSQNPSIH
ncbi:MAG: hypothetical protein GKR87_05465 [Kiritimatiellae bacterium]|nr:hypothetical protein [Kiritimatiellia bacterium]